MTDVEQVLEQAQHIVQEWAEGRRDITAIGVQPSTVPGFGHVFEIFMTITPEYRSHHYYFSDMIHPSSFFYSEEDRDAILEMQVQRAYISFHQAIRSGELDEQIDREAEAQERWEAEAASAGSGRGKGETGEKPRGGRRSRQAGDKGRGA